MYKFLAGLRWFVSFIDLERMGLGTLVHDVIRDHLIPRLRRKMESAGTDRDREMISSLINEYEQYSDERNPKSEIYGQAAANMIRTQTGKFALPTSDMDDMSQNLALDFFQPLRSGGGNLQSVLLRFDEMRGPLELNKYWANIVKLRTIYRIREEMRKHKEGPFRQREDTGESEEVNLRAPAPLDEGYIRTVMAHLLRFMRSKLSGEMFGLFKRWFDVAQKNGIDKVKMTRDVYAPLRDSGYEASPSTMSWWWNDIRKLIVEFFDKELEGSVGTDIRRMLKVSSTEILTYEQFRRRIAKWMLGGLIRSVIEGR